MKKVNFKILAMAVAMGLFVLSCANDAAKKQDAVKDAAKDATEKVKDAADAATESANATVKAIEEKVTKELDAKMAQTSGWPENEFTALVPKPDLKCGASGSTKMGFSVVFVDATPEQVKAYAAQVKKAGFSKNAYEMTGETYMFNAENKDGVGVLISSASGQSGILITPKKK